MMRLAIYAKILQSEVTNLMMLSFRLDCWGEFPSFDFLSYSLCSDCAKCSLKLRAAPKYIYAAEIITIRPL